MWTPLARVASVLRLSGTATIRALATLGDVRPSPLETRPVAAASVDAVKDAVASALHLTDIGEFARTSARRLIVQAC